MIGQMTSIFLGIAASLAACGCVNSGAGHALAQARQSPDGRVLRRTVLVDGRGKAVGRGGRARLGAARAAHIDAYRNALTRGVGGPATRRNGARRLHGRVAGCKEVSSAWDEVKNEYRVTLECPARLPRNSLHP